MSNTTDERARFVRRLARALALAERADTYPHCIALALLVALDDLSKQPGFDLARMIAHLEVAGIRVVAVGLDTDSDADPPPECVTWH